jgi:hypothetical protein
VLGVALPLADTATAIALHREIGERLVAIDRAVSAMDHYVDVLRLDPDLVEDQRRLRHLAENTGEFLIYVRGLLAAAEVATDKVRRVACSPRPATSSTTRCTTPPRRSTSTRRCWRSPRRRRTRRGGSRGASTTCSKRQVAAASARRARAAGAARDRVRAVRGARRRGPRWRSALGEPERALATGARASGSTATTRGAGRGDRADRAAGPLERAGRTAASARQRPGRAAPAPRRPDARVAGIEAEQLERSRRPRRPRGRRSRASSATPTRASRRSPLLARRSAGPSSPSCWQRDRSRHRADRGPLDPPRRRLPRAARPGRRAVACYGAALTADPAHAGAREGLLATLDDAEARPAAVALLGKLYRGREEWPELAKIVESRLEVTEDPLQARPTSCARRPRCRSSTSATRSAALALLRRPSRSPRPTASSSVTSFASPRDRATGAPRSTRTATASSASATATAGGPPSCACPRPACSRRSSEIPRALEAYTAVLSLDARHPEAVRGALRTGGPRRPLGRGRRGAGQRDGRRRRGRRGAASPRSRPTRPRTAAGTR